MPIEPGHCPFVGAKVDHQHVFLSFFHSKVISVIAQISRQARESSLAASRLTVKSHKYSNIVWRNLHRVDTEMVSTLQ
jgi:hypothetical protein